MWEVNVVLQEYLRHYVTKTKSWMKSSQQELEKLRADSVDMQQGHSKQLQDQRQQHKEQLHQQVQQHEGEQAQLQKQVEALQERHAQETAHLRAQIVRHQADRARQDEKLNLLRGLCAFFRSVLIETSFAHFGSCSIWT